MLKPTLGIEKSIKLMLKKVNLISWANFFKNQGFVFNRLVFVIESLLTVESVYVARNISYSAVNCGILFKQLLNFSDRA